MMKDLELLCHSSILEIPYFEQDLSFLKSIADLYQKWKPYIQVELVM